MKKTLNEKTVNSIPVSRKALGVVALVGLFACGVFVGATLNNNRAPSSDDKVIKFSEQDCYSLINKMTTTNDADMVEKLKEVYNDNCANRIIYTEPVTVPDDADDKSGDVTTCERIEQLLSQQLYSEKDGREYAHLDNAHTYARLAERGCPENVDKYRALAAREIEIATALIPVEDMSESDVEDVVDVYKKVKMQAAAQQVIDTLQKASEPTIDFILKLEKIINEE